MIIDTKRLIKCFVAPIAVGLLSYFAVGGDFSAFENASSSPLTPPPAVFTAVWILLYILMGLNLYIITSGGDEQSITSQRLFAVGLILNFTYTVLFFKYSMPAASLICVCLLWLCVLLYTVISVRRKDIGWVFSLPYLLWLSFAIYLTLFIVLSN